MAVVELDIAKFRSMRPEFTEGVISDDTITTLWGFACEIVGNTDATSLYAYNPDLNINTRAYVLYLALCHLCTLYTLPPGQPGRIASASEGSVSTSFDLIKANSYVAQWWSLTPCGSTYWAFTSAFRLGGRFYGGTEYHPWG